MNDLVEIEHAITERGFDPSAVWTLLKAVLFGDKGVGCKGKPRKNFALTEHLWDTRGRKREPRKFFREKDGSILLCYECGTPINRKQICPECGRDNQYAIMLGVCKVLEE